MLWLSAIRHAFALFHRRHFYVCVTEGMARKSGRIQAESGTLCKAESRNCMGLTFICCDVCTVFMHSVLYILQLKVVNLNEMITAPDVSRLYSN